MNTNGLKYGQVTEQMIESAYEVHHALGHGFLEKVYENALALHLRHKGVDVEQQAPISVHYMDQSVGAYFTELLVDGEVIVELKTVDRIQPVREVQLVNYLKAGGIELGLLLNFGQKVEIRRKIFTL